MFFKTAFLAFAVAILQNTNASPLENSSSLAVAEAPTPADTYTPAASAYYIPGDTDYNVGYSDITCWDGVGTQCNDPVQDAIALAIRGMADSVWYDWTYNNWDSSGYGSVTEEDSTGQGVYATIAYGPVQTDFTSGSVFYDFYGSLEYYTQLQTMAYQIAADMSASNLNAIEACVQFTTNGEPFVGGYYVVAIGWGGAEYVFTGNELVDFWDACSDN